MDIDADMIDPALSGGAAPTNTTAKNQTSQTDDEEDDPIVATYNIFLKPSLPAHRKIVILEHPNKAETNKPTRTPTEIRMKPDTGMVEVDYPIDYHNYYDRAKGLSWGTNLNKSTEAKKGGSHGLAGGFGVGAPPPRARRAGAAADEDLGFGMDWNEALRRDFVLRTQTLGGQSPNASEESRYMVGVFSGGNLHLTPASSLVHLRPQLHHIDATSEQEKLTSARAGGAGGAQAGKEGPARAIHMTIKSAGADGDEIVQETMADRLRKVQSEAWKRMRYVHDEATDSWAMSEDALYLRPEAPPATAAVGKEVESVTALPELVDKVARLETKWSEDHMLEQTSGVEKETIDTDDEENPSRKPKSPAKGKGKGKAVSADEGAEKKPPGRPKGSSTTAATKKVTAAKSKRSTATKPGPSKPVKVD